MSRAIACAFLLPAAALSQDHRNASEEIEVLGHYLNAVGTDNSASSGTYTQELIQDRPLLRPGEIEELVPGLIVTQHSGAGKANQFFLRGFNLDHGTDFASSLDGIPLNLPSHAHGQGYLDLNSVIPELIGRVDYFKGPYFASKGDFASAGATDLFYVDSVPKPRVEVTGGSDGYYRTLAIASPEVGPGKLLVALEAQHQDGPWDNPDDYSKYNAVLRYTLPVGEGSASLMAQGYGGKWNATDQIPLRAVLSGALDRFGAEDPSDGGRSHRYTLSAHLDEPVAAGELRATAFVSRYDLDLFSDFTYFLDDPVHGDQMEQSEHRFVEGVNGRWRSAVSAPVRFELGWDARVDHIAPLGLFHTENRRRLAASSVDSVGQGEAAVYASADARLSSWLRIELGLRATGYDFRVRSSDPRNSGDETAGLLLPKATLVAGPFAKTELYANFGEDYHSNDARGVTATVDARSGESIAKVSPLPRSEGYELGIRSELLRDAQLSAAFWLLDLDSELVWDADAGTTVPSARTRREGIELSGRYHPFRWLLFDADLALSRARFRDFDPAGQYVPEGVSTALSAGATVHQLGPLSLSVFLRYFGPRALTQDDSKRSGGSFLVDAQASFRLTRDLSLSVQLFNLFDAQVDDIAYFYPSRLRGEAGAVDDIHFHPAEPRAVRAGFSLSL